MNLTANDEPSNLWRSLLLVFGLFIAYVLVKHRLVVLRVAPVRTDPCDAVNAFAILTIAFIAFASLLRMFSSSHPSSPLRYLYIVRSQQAVLFAIFLTCLGQIVAMVRRPAMWVGSASQIRLFALLGALTVVTLATQMLILFTERGRILLSSMRWTRTALPVVIAIVALAVCPEYPTYSSSTTAHILTVAVGGLAFLIPMRLLLAEIVLSGSGVGERPAFGTAREWVSLMGGVVAMLLAFWRPLEHTHIPIVVAVVGQFLIAYAVLGAPLGFAESPENSRSRSTRGAAF